MTRAAPLPFAGTASFAASCALVAEIQIRRGAVERARAIASDLRATPGLLGTVMAAHIIEERAAAALLAANSGEHTP